MLDCLGLGLGPDCGKQRIAVSFYEKVVVFPAKSHDILLRCGGFADGAGCNAELM
jgi:hypothetical protein